MARSCCLATCQAPIQAFLRPAIWVPGIRNLHLATETWEMSDCTIEAAMDAVIQGVENIADEENLRVRQDDRNHHYLKIWSFTAHCNWLDIVEIRFTAVSDSVTHAEARSYSSGVLPACCPLAFIFNCLFFWVPFSGNGFNIHRLEAIRKAISGINVNVIQHGPTCC